MGNKEFVYILFIALLSMVVCILLGVLIGSTNLEGAVSNVTWTDMLSGFGGLIGALATMVAATFAGLALTSWKKQTQAQRQILFLDELTEAFNEYSNLISVPIELITYSKLAIEGYSFSDSKGQTFGESGVVKYFKRVGQEDAEKINQYLNKCTGSLNKIQSLTIKGNLMGFHDYHTCFDACARLAKTYPAIQAYSSMISNKYLNWNNPEVEIAVRKVIEMDPNDLNAIVNSCNKELIKFAQNKYRLAMK
ncbi:hypothetical protein [Vibrio vulnificus]|uniref:hypothetical protein n=1 Tax=Vibrio vulnificus TaxID=672 RepID=UPI0010297F17|nr:hypothetical protein [Vibrio vulnificus]RZR34224.1 hypothetical protein D8T59_20930 [Vibrio vulnificus]